MALILIIKPCSTCTCLCKANDIWLGRFFVFFLTFADWHTHTLTHRVIFSRDVTVEETVSDARNGCWFKCMRLGQNWAAMFTNHISHLLTYSPPRCFLTCLFFLLLDRGSFKTLEEILSWSKARFDTIAFSCVYTKHMIEAVWVCHTHFKAPDNSKRIELLPITVYEIKKEINAITLNYQPESASTYWNSETHITSLYTPTSCVCL